MFGHFIIDNPVLSVYAATKFALTAISQGTRFELLAENAAGLNCRVSVRIYLCLLFNAGTLLSFSKPPEVESCFRARRTHTNSGSPVWLALEPRI